MYYLFHNHNWGLRDLQELWRCDTGWRDLIFAMSSHESDIRRKQPPPTAAVKTTKKRK